ncbi:MAG: DUF1778 domain-containing protein [Lactobacillales bacterium]|nr:DUF1778 domain-containing protein [Lactobacillales bacterium]
MLSVRTTKEEEELIKKFASFQGLSVSSLLKQAVMEKIEDEYDLKLYQEAKKRDEKSYDINDVANDLGIKL